MRFRGATSWLRRARGLKPEFGWARNAALKAPLFHVTAHVNPRVTAYVNTRALLRRARHAGGFYLTGRASRSNFWGGFGAGELFQDCAQGAQDFFRGGCFQNKFEHAVGGELSAALGGDEAGQLLGVDGGVLLELEIYGVAFALNGVY